MLLHPNDPRLTWEGLVSLEAAADWAKPWRLPHEQAALFPPPELMERAGMPSGVRLCFRSDTRRVVGTIVPRAEMAPIDLIVDGELWGTAPLAGRDRFQFLDLPPGEKDLELWLPQFGDFRLAALELDDGATVSPWRRERFRWITYGSSITQCRGAASPSLTWPAIVARARDWNLLSLGFGGQCHLDPMIARLIRDLPADFISMCLGINVYGASSLSARTFRPAVIGMVQIIREGHPTVPIALLSPIVSPPREETPNAVGMTLQAMRREVAAAADALQAAGDKNLHYVNGMEILGPKDADLLPDALHPNADGYRLMGERFLKRVVEPIFGPQP